MMTHKPDVTRIAQIGISSGPVFVILDDDDQIIASSTDGKDWTKRTP